ncbi:hypothetical protein A2962_01525 [Candidatus Woesebacteria bacterium RIFCSPLOWO2_01_FULL_39_61]|uniref:GP-PDE domain-containing protein n=1 Tax=Candidatus Woesebacteria bacterium RIFCSPHIGHO2_02_FULL_39_13 TaxID=1802505 RepID=A0A1F7Z4X4_9BACT|nr:MAG: hypothetical protein A2692_01765 [Candidatus Woesebacteria bacterium RIFCSPHIGHO2_01_FULL_39_95]OGM34524.1 MAG: hypothetical protein A3D01_03215 [Candidatus Woesebacteria bacterium RIFCSPHIGHO2_02_FULL_39_13]OGM38791.1 MAG: hypothetical protein A3E13_01110 [Candidatus Woesebacteria bacterium RIFCSPHIGHO2_12_FULL_40_20]OGM65797.1 MAG: hypothetical protein A2962_01525 [Candidatus Woesebacteria bacterium RIFCSPLOWO2_01_FULL_39_61]OGM73870.1 MAG: hypothetical protein A3H19_04370 [Candidatus
MSNLLVLGHRGDRKSHDDNTIEGIKSAFDKGADGVEIDVYYQPNKGVYLTHKFLHDKNLDYPKLEEVIETFSDKGKIQIEIKPPEIETVKAVVDLVYKHKLENFEITSGILPLLRYIRELAPKANIGMITKPYLIEDWMTEEFGDYLMLSYLKLTGASTIWLDKPEGFWNKDRVERFHKKGYKIGSHLPTDSKEDYEKLLSLGIDSCTADDLNVLKWRATS